MRLGKECPSCKKEVKGIQSQFIAMNKQHYVYQCGHLEIIPLVSELKIEAAPQAHPPEEIKEKNALEQSLSFFLGEGQGQCLGNYPIPDIHESFWAFEKKCKPYFCKECNKEHTRKHAYKYQREGVVFAEKAQLKSLIADAMGLGKTIQDLLIMKRNGKHVFPALVLTKGAVVFQYATEFKTWVHDGFSGVMPVTAREHIIPGFECYIMSMDFLARKGVLEAVIKLNLKSIHLDECQSYKDPSAKRTIALIKLIQASNINIRQAYSGTPIKNRVSEYFTVLNILDPLNFDSEIGFKRRWLVQNEKGQYTRLNPIYAEDFKDMTARYIIRREKHDVLTDLPPLMRDYQIIEIQDEWIKKTYNHEVGLFKSYLKTAGDAKINSTALLGWLARLRAITGQAKITHAVDWTGEFLDSSEDSLSIAIHHESVRETLMNVFRNNNLNPISLSGKDNIYDKNRIARDFNSGKHRILVINALAGGVGLNLQSCANALVLERQWNSADEEQFESRFHRDGQKKGVTITYLIAKGTIDEFFHDMVYKKRNILAEAGIGNPDEETNSIGFLKEFAEFVANQTI